MPGMIEVDEGGPSLAFGTSGARSYAATDGAGCAWEGAGSGARPDDGAALEDTGAKGPGEDGAPAEDPADEGTP
jgi:hypothetical protein